MQLGFCLLKYYYSYQVNEIVCIEALHKDLCIKFGYITKMAYCCGKTSLHCYYAKMCRTGEYACDTCSTHLYIIAGKGCSFVYLRNCVFYAHAAYTSTVLDLGKSRLTPSRSPTETTWRMRSALKWRHTLQSKLQTCKSKSP